MRLNSIYISVIFILILVFVQAFLGLFVFKLVQNDKVTDIKKIVVAKEPEFEPVEVSVASVDNDSEIIEQELEQELTTLLAVGDIMLSRTVEKKMLEKDNFYYPFEQVQELLGKADITFGNLETAVIAGRSISVNEMVFRADPEVVKVMADVGFDIVSLANNHTGNFGQEGFLKTFETLEQNGIEYIGAGPDKKSAYQAKYYEQNGIKFAFLAYGYGPIYYEAGENKAGMALMDTQQMKQDVAVAKEFADLVFVSMHAGSEYTEIISDKQRLFAQAAIDSGAEAVIGHHPHVVQKIEKYKDKYIFYSLGNFIFDQMWSDNTRNGLAVKIYLNKQGIQHLEFIPIKIYDYAQAKIMNEQEVDKVLSRLKVDVKDVYKLQWNREYDLQKTYFENNFEDQKQNFFETDINENNILEKTYFDVFQVTVEENEKIIWQSHPAWQVENLQIADINNDGQDDWNMSLWLTDEESNVSNRFFIYCWKKDKIDACWDSSPLDDPIDEMKILDFNNDELQELIVIDEDTENENQKYLSVWQWNGWGVSLDKRFDVGNVDNMYQMQDEIIVY